MVHILLVHLGGILRHNVVRDVSNGVYDAFCPLPQTRCPVPRSIVLLVHLGGILRHNVVRMPLIGAPRPARGWSVLSGVPGVFSSAILVWGPVPFCPPAGVSRTNHARFFAPTLCT